MEIVLAAVVAAVVAGGVVLLAQRTAPRARVVAPVGAAPTAPVGDGREAKPRERAEPVAALAPETISDIEHELRERRSEIARAEERILGKEQSIDVRLGERAEQRR